jgi:ABC-type lipoprotein export system ATPase subunit
VEHYSGAEILALFKELHAEGRTVILVTHDEMIASRAHRVIRILDGRIEK